VVIYRMLCSWQVRVICSSPDGVFLLTIDEDGRCLLINKRRRALLHRFSFRGPVGAAKFSPDGKFIACGVGKVLQVRLTLNTS
jgi:periodic tryptophan protein 2